MPRVHAVTRRLGPPLLILLTVGLCHAADTTAPPFEVTELSPNVLVLTTQPWAANTLLVRGEGGLVLVDTPATPADTAAVLDWVEERWGAPPRYAVNSHWHIDAAGGNQVLIERGVEVISSEKTAEILIARGEGLRRSLVESFSESDPETAAELQSLKPTPATRTPVVNRRVELDLDGDRVVLVHVAPSHTEDSIGVFFPAERVLYGGCVVRSNGRIVNRDDADADGWVRTLQAFADLDPVFVVPGHGRRFDPAMIPESLVAARALGAEDGSP